MSGAVYMNNKQRSVMALILKAYAVNLNATMTDSSKNWTGTQSG